MTPSALSQSVTSTNGIRIVGASVDERIVMLQELLSIIDTRGTYLVRSLEKEKAEGKTSSQLVPPKDIFEATQDLLGAAGMLPEVVQDPGMRCLQMCGSYFEARAFHITIKLGIPDLIAQSSRGEMTALELGKATGVEYRKLARILRLLATNHILAEVGHDTYALNRISAQLVDNPALSSYIHHYGEEPYFAAGALMNKIDTPQGASYDILDAPFSDVYGRKPRWEWLEQPDEKTGMPREQLARFGLAMLGAGDVEVPGVLLDYDWASLQRGAIVVDVGGGVGQMAIALGREYPNLNFVVQDRPPVVEQGKRIWQTQASDILQRVELQAYDFFTPQPVSGAAIYLLRHVIHDWADKESIEILRQLKPALAPHSRILLAEQLMVCSSGDDRIKRAPFPLPANWGAPSRFNHQRDINMMSLINGIERSPREFDALVQAAGLKVTAFHPCRSQIGLVEVSLP